MGKKNKLKTCDQRIQWDHQLQRFRSGKQKLPSIISLPFLDCFRYCPHNPQHPIERCHNPHHIDKSWCIHCQEFVRCNWHQCSGDDEDDPADEELILALRNQQWSHLPPAFIAATDHIAIQVYGHSERIDTTEELPRYSSYHNEPKKRCTGYWDDVL